MRCSLHAVCGVFRGESSDLNALYDSTMAKSNFADNSCVNVVEGEGNARLKRRPRSRLLQTKCLETMYIVYRSVIIM